MQRYFSISPSSSSKLGRIKAPLPMVGWMAKDPRVRPSGIAMGCSFLDGNYRTVWEHFDVSVRQAVTSSMAFVKGGASELPRGLMIPLTEDGAFLRHFVRDSIREAKRSRLAPYLKRHVNGSIFDRKYDLICPLPSSKGPATGNNLSIANLIAEEWNKTDDEASTITTTNSTMNKTIPLAHLIERKIPMTIKSTATKREMRRHEDAPRLMHYDNMCLNGELMRLIPNASILLYDDVFTWGNTSEAARNLLLMAGAANVDVITCFNTGDLCWSRTYTPKQDRIPVDLTQVGADRFQLVDSIATSKDDMSWENQSSMSDWHTCMKIYVAKHFPQFVPNDIPF